VSSFTISEGITFFPKERIICSNCTNEEKQYLENYIVNRFGSTEDLNVYNDNFFPNNDVKGDNIYPSAGGICLTESCQLRCNYCSFSSGESNITTTFEEIKAFVNFLIKNLIFKRMIYHEEYPLRIVITGGGEPTYKWDEFVYAIEYIKEKCSKNNIHYYINATTNGILKEKQIKYLIDNINFIMVSFDGIPTIQNKNRKTANGSGTADIVECTLKMLDDENANFSIRTTIWPEDYCHINEMADFVLSNYKNVKGWDIEPIIPRGRAIRHNSFESESRFVDLNFSHYYIEAKKHILTHNYHDVLSCSKFNNVTCGTIYGFHPWLIPNGKVVTCQDAKEKAIQIGRIDNGKYIPNDFHDNYAKICKESSKKCSTCFAYGFCLSGCPLKYLNSESRETAEIECNMIRAYWKNVLVNLVKNNEYLGFKLEEIETIGKTKIFKMEESS
jgi:radical SAM protein with 4Fe4S-binding SPASM domain